MLSSTDPRAEAPTANPVAVELRNILDLPQVERTRQARAVVEDLVAASDLTRATALADTLVGRDLMGADPRLWLARALARRGRRENGLSAVARAGNLTTKNDMLHAAETLGMLGARAEAAQLCWRCLETWPDTPRAYRRLFALHGGSTMGRGAAILALRMLIRTGLEDPALAVEAAGLLERADLPPEAVWRAQAMRDRLCAGREDAEVWRARSLWETGNAAGAAQVLDAFLAHTPNHVAARRFRGVLALKAGAWGRDTSHIAPLLKDTGEAAPAALNRYRDACALLNVDPMAPPKTLSTPASIIAHVCDTAPRANHAPDREGVVMICGSLAAGGAEKMLALTTRALRARGAAGKVDLWLFHTTGMGALDPLHNLALSGVPRDEVVELQPTGPLTDPFRFLPPFMGAKAQAIRERLAKRRPRTVHAWLDQANLPAALGAILSGAPNILLHCHNLRPTTLSGGEDACFGWADSYRALLARPEVRLVACAETARQDYLDWTGARADATATVLNGFDFTGVPTGDAATALRADHRKAFDVPQDALLIGGAIRFQPVKRPDRWVEAAAIIARALPSAQFVLFGEGPLLARTRDLAATLGLAGRLRLPGHVPDLTSRLPMLDLFMLSSDSEGLPNVLIEAQAARIPVIAPDVGGCGETMDVGATGRLATPGSASALARTAIATLSDRDWMDRARIAAPLFVRGRFALERMVADLEALYDA